MWLVNDGRSWTVGLCHCPLTHQSTPVSRIPGGRRGHRTHSTRNGLCPLGPCPHSRLRSPHCDLLPSGWTPRACRARNWPAAFVCGIWAPSTPPRVAYSPFYHPRPPSSWTRFGERKPWARKNFGCSKRTIGSAERGPTRRCQAACGVTLVALYTNYCVLRGEEVLFIEFPPPSIRPRPRFTDRGLPSSD